MDVLISADRFRAFAPGCALLNASAIGKALEEGRERVGLTTPARVQHFMAQMAHESGGFTRLEENLSYSAERLTVVWRKRFPTIEAAEPFARKPYALAEKAYGGRMGNDQPGDGWKYRGRGIVMLTGKDNYRTAVDWSGLPLLDDPDLACSPTFAARIALAFWKHKALNDEADRDDIEAISKAINGGLVGLDDRKAWLAKARRVFK